MPGDVAMLTLQVAILALIALPAIGLVLGKRRVDARKRSVHQWAAPEATRVTAVSPAHLPELEERVFATTRARSPGR
jgi:hypothetical protein